MTRGIDVVRTVRGRVAVVVLVVAALGVVLAPTSAVTSSAIDSSNSDPVGTYLAQARDEIDLPHLAVATSGGAGGDGWWSSGAGPRLDADSQLVVGSVAKSMTAALVVRLVDAGRLQLADDVGALLAEPSLLGVAVEQLLTHRGGFTALDGLRVSERDALGPDALHDAVDDLQATGTRGGYAYSSASYLVLGAVVEEVTGRRFADVLRSDLTDPLGMRDTTALRADADLVPGHRWLLGRPRTLEQRLDEGGASYGYVASTPRDLQRWAQAQVGARPDVLDRRALDVLHAPRVDAGADRYGFGWRVDGDGDDRVVHHTGAVPGFFTHVLVRPSDGSTVVVVADAYGEAQAPTLAAVAPDVLALLDGEERRPTSPDPVLTAVPWVLLVLVAAGFVAGAVLWRRRPGRGTRVLLVLLAAVLASATWWAPGLLGSDLGVLLTWAPDTGATLVALTVVWAGVALAALAPRRRMFATSQ